MKYLVTVAVMCFLQALDLFAQTHNPNFVDLPNARVLVAKFDDNYLYIGGDFTQCGAVPRHFLARYDRYTGALDMTWDPNPDGGINSIELANGSVYIAGIFNSIGGQTRHNLAKLSVTGAGDADPLWDPNPDSYVQTIVVSGNDAFIGGYFTSVNGQARSRIAKISATGTGDVDPLWNPGADLEVNALELQGLDLFVGGGFTFIGGQARNKIAKLSSTGTGTPDATWNPNAVFGYIFSLDVEGSDVYVGGNFTTIGGQARNNIAKVSASGTGLADPTWNPNADNWVFTVNATPEGVFAGGYFTTIGGQSRNYAAKLSSTGTGAADPSWSVPFNNNIDSRTIAFSNGIVCVIGQFNAPSAYMFVTGTYAVPTLNEWGMIAFTVSIVGVGVYFSRRKFAIA